MNILVFGAAGHMGREVAAKCEEHYAGAVLSAGVDLMLPASDKAAHLYKSPFEVTEPVDCIVDFSHHSATAVLLDYAVKKTLPVVLCTTGQTEEENGLIEKACAKIPVFRSANMSLGIALLVKTAKQVAAAMPDADIEIVETHHNRKLDAPSGTALMLARSLQEVREGSTLVCGRNGMAKREKNDIGISSVRVGNVVGIHEVIIGTASQTITLKHEAHSRALFAEGALCAAEFLCGKKPGLYDMNSMIEKM